MATFGRDSSLQIIFEPSAPPRVPAASAEASPVQPLNGTVIGCACPECQGPMSVRLWLLTADCWRCGTSIELTLQQEQALRRQLQPQAPPAPEPAQPPKAEPPPVSPVPAPPARKPSNTSEPRPQAPSAPPRRAALIAAPPVQAPPLGPAAAPTAIEQRSALSLRDLVALLVSAVVHALLILLLGLWTFSDRQDDPEIVLSVTLSKLHRTGGDPSEVKFHTTDFELPFDQEPRNKAEREALLKANQDARELRLPPDDQSQNLPPLSRVKADLQSPDPYRRMQAARDPRLRAEIVKREGGTTQTEAAVARGLRWLAAHQSPDGSWSIDDFHRHGDCQGRCGGRAQMRSDTAGTAMVLMAMLGTGQTHQTGIYRDQISSGLGWLVSHQKPNGDLRANSTGHSGMYAHALATLALCDAFKMTGDETLRAPAQRAIDFICEAQHPAGGWRYNPGESGDTSVVGWKLMALHSARSAYLRVPQRTLDLAGKFLDNHQADKDGASYFYYPNNRRASPTMTSVGLLSRMYLGWNRRDPGLEIGVDVLSSEFLPKVDGRDRGNIYYWYYATQVMHHWGGEPWERWNRHLREALVTTQITSGHEAGSWPPSLDPHGGQGGRLYVTALATCTLEVYYRYAPLYWQLELD